MTAHSWMCCKGKNRNETHSHYCCYLHQKKSCEKKTGNIFRIIWIPLRIKNNKVFAGLLTKCRRPKAKEKKKDSRVCFPIDLHCNIVNIRVCIYETTRTSASEQRTLNTRRALLRLQLKKCTASRLEETCCLLLNSK